MTTRLNDPNTLRRRDILALFAAGAVAWPARVFGQEAPTPQALMAKAVPFLRTRQGEDGGWSTQRGPGVSAIVTAGLMRSKQVTAADPMMAKALAYLEGTVGPNGGFDEKGQANTVILVAQARGGKWVTVWPDAVASQGAELGQWVPGNR